MPVNNSFWSVYNEITKYFPSFLSTFPQAITINKKFFFKNKKRKNI